MNRTEVGSARCNPGWNSRQIPLQYAGFHHYTTMAVQQNRKTPSKRGMRRSHDALKGPTLSRDATTGELHRRHHVGVDGYYRGRKVVDVINPED